MAAARGGGVRLAAEKGERERAALVRGELLVPEEDGMGNCLQGSCKNTGLRAGEAGGWQSTSGRQATASCLGRTWT